MASPIGRRAGTHHGAPAVTGSRRCAQEAMVPGKDLNLHGLLYWHLEAVYQFRHGFGTERERQCNGRSVLVNVAVAAAGRLATANAAQRWQNRLALVTVAVPAPTNSLTASECGAPLTLGVRRRFRHPGRSKPWRAAASAGRTHQGREGRTGGEYCLLGKLDAVAGTVSAHRDGFGFWFLTTLPTTSGCRRRRCAALDGDRGGGARLRGRAPRRNRHGDTRAGRTSVARYHREHGIGWVVESGVLPSVHHSRSISRVGQPVSWCAWRSSNTRSQREAQGRIVRHRQSGRSASDRRRDMMFELPRMVSRAGGGRRSAATSGRAIVMAVPTCATSIS